MHKAKIATYRQYRAIQAQNMTVMWRPDLPSCVILLPASSEAKNGGTFRNVVRIFLGPTSPPTSFGFQDLWQRE